METELVKLIFISLLRLRKQKRFKDIEISPISLEHPRTEEFGDWSTNIAMTLGRRLKIDPLELGRALVKIMNKSIVQYDLTQIDLVKPGFINFYLDPAYFHRKLFQILKAGQGYGQSKSGGGQKVMVEFISANPTGPLTLGNARGGFLGDALARVLAWRGYKVVREYYLNDTGKQIEALGHSVLKDEQAVYRGDYIDALAKRNHKSDPQAVGAWASQVITKELVSKTVARMQIDFDHWFSEKSLHTKGDLEETMMWLKRKGYTQEKEGALWFLASKFPYDQNQEKKDCVLVKRNGEYTYLAGDLAYHQDKFLRRKFDTVINIWGADHHGDVPRLQAGVAALGIDVEKRLKIILVQFVRLIEQGREVRMSKRKGTYITIDALLDQIGLDVARFFFLSHEPNSHMDFDLTLAKDRSEKNPVYYVQYAHARICGILKKAGRFRAPKANLSLLKHPSEMRLIKHLIRFPEVVERAASPLDHYAVHQLPYYAINLADKFHKFYKDCRVIGDDPELTRARLALTLAAKFVFQNTLGLIGITTPQKM